MSEKKVVIKQDEEKPVAAEVLANSIIAISEAVKQMLNAGLKQETIVVLVRASTALPKADIRNVLNALQNLRQEYCTR